MKSNRILVTIVAVLACLGCRAQDDYMATVRYDDTALETFSRVAAALKPHKDAPAGDLMVRCAKLFLGTEYVAGTLEQEPEQLTINLNKTDCILFVEMCLAMVQTVKSDNPTFEQFCRNTQSLRYKDGRVDGYTSRNHYTSSWIRQGEKNGVFKDVSRDLGGSKLEQEFNFMSTHTDAYKQLAGNPAQVAQIRTTEAELKQGDYYYLPQDSLPRLQKGIRNGDIICFVSRVKGLDIGHVAIAVEQDSQMHFIHASTKAMKVIIDSQTIADYVATHSSSTGVRVVRLN